MRMFQYAVETRVYPQQGDAPYRAGAVFIGFGQAPAPVFSAVPRSLSAELRRRRLLGVRDRF